VMEFQETEEYLSLDQTRAAYKTSTKEKENVIQ
jgi:hypothetical protein